jgi:hypothetical protein
MYLHEPIQGSNLNRRSITSLETEMPLTPRTASSIYATAVMPIRPAIKRELPVSVRPQYDALGTNNVQYLSSSIGATVSNNWHTADSS